MPPSPHLPGLRWRVAQYLEIRWWRRYLRRLPAPDYLAAKRAYWARVLATAGVQPPPGARVLDAGCGPAGVFIALPQQQVDALDPLLPAYTQQLTHFQPSQYPWTHFIPLPLEQFVPDQPYPWLLCFNAINHVANWELALDRLTAAAAPGAHLVLAVDVHRWTVGRTIFRRLPADALHPQQHHRHDYLAALAARGWRLQHQTTLKPGWIFDYWLAIFTTQ